MALGAQRGAITALVLRQALLLAGIGLVAGVAGAMASTRFLAGMLFGLTPLDPSTYISVTLVFATVASVACYVPARRAIGIDPVAALRCE